MEELDQLGVELLLHIVSLFILDSALEARFKLG